ncbi:MAG TPA: single-stranded DNA-binding protein [Candidatus Paceibacterota bacterium]|nr:single-stranded DNA-binding protein [Verrucomicrobiota bacterium]HOX02311.1 single-stranded DNA-binding protein [Verrucomicrobiota bacterium]HRZ45103.1 single-stranded DNA-binding protein [Candidatus Paceibacterota bacterium]HRZ92163.1 single-stranded DNA-binding protein [Candidatus Paceibacterota bacterium]
MASYNRVILIGNLTRDPELRYTPKGSPVSTIGIAVNRSWRDEATGTSHEETTFVDVDCFGRSAENISKYMKKGRPILIEGRLRQDSWEDKQGQKRSKLVVVCENFRFIDSGNRNAPAEDGPPPARAANPPPPNSSRAAEPAPSSAAPETPADNSPAEEDDVPF